MEKINLLYAALIGLIGIMLSALMYAINEKAGIVCLVISTGYMAAYVITALVALLIKWVKTWS